MAKLSIMVTGHQNLLDRLTKLDVPKNCEKVVKEITAKQHAEEVRDAPVDTGYLQQNIKSSVESSDGITVGTVDSGADYSVYQEYGTRYQSGTPYIRHNFYKNKELFKKKMKGALDE